MDHLLGMVGDGYALVAADRKVSNSIIAVKHDEDKILALDESKLLGCVGELGDTCRRAARLPGYDASRIGPPVQS